MWQPSRIIREGHKLLRLEGHSKLEIAIETASMPIDLFHRVQNIFEVLNGPAIEVACDDVSKRANRIERQYHRRHH